MRLRPTCIVQANTSVLSVCQRLRCSRIALECLFMKRRRRRKLFPVSFRLSCPVRPSVPFFELFVLVLWNGCQSVCCSMSETVKACWWSSSIPWLRSNWTSTSWGWLTVWKLTRLWHSSLEHVCARSTGILLVHRTDFYTRTRLESCLLLTDPLRWFGSWLMVLRRKLTGLNWYVLFTLKIWPLVVRRLSFPNRLGCST